MIRKTKGLVKKLIESEKIDEVLSSKKGKVGVVAYILFAPLGFELGAVLALRYLAKELSSEENQNEDYYHLREKCPQEYYFFRSKY